MSKLKHTPKCWSEIKYIPINLPKEKHFIGVIKSTGLTEYDIICKLNGMEKIQEADAKLMAAAPEMVEALIDVYIDGMRNNRDIYSLKKIIEKARGLSIEEILNGV